MTELNQIYRCNVCGNIVEVLRSGAGELVCCSQLMELLEAHTGDEGLEKHVPVTEGTSDGFRVKVGSTPHPMEENHHITLIELLADDRIYRRHLKAGDKPEALFCIEASRVSAREYCNIHGLWSNR